jgi:cytochrome c oxidase assembly protein subunit 15
LGKFFPKIVIINIILVYLVIIAGSVVRTSGAGMGCPDWPKCFDCWIPPTQLDQLPDNYKEIYAEKREKKLNKFAKLLTALGMEDKAEALLNDPEILKEEDFNARKTWTEYINRVFGFLSGNGVLIMFIISILKFKKRKDVFWLSFATLILLVYTAWLGSIVVATNLIPWIITAHMLPAFLIIALLIVIYYKSKEHQKPYSGKPFKWLIILFVLLTMVQVYLGTRVRQEIDTLSSSDIIRAAWVDNLDMNFYLHRSFSWVILILLGSLWYVINKANFPKRQLVILTTLIAIEIFTGIIMAYLDVPAFSQPMHLLMSTLIFGLLITMFIKTNKAISD